MDMIYIKLLYITPLIIDVIKHIKSFIYEKINDQNFHQAIQLWFSNKKACLDIFGHISYWDVSKVKYMNNAFAGYLLFNEDISKWNVRNVINMEHMFYNAENFNSNISNWDVLGVENMSYMFAKCKSFNQDLSKWKIPENSEKMFYK